MVRDMKDTNYAFAVSSVRFLEKELLKKDFFNRLMQAPDFDAVGDILEDKGFDLGENGDISRAVNEKTREMWEDLRELAPDERELWFLIVKNDFHNLKTCLKSLTANGHNPRFAYPCIVEPSEISDAVKKKSFDGLPPFLEKCAEKAYGLYTGASDVRLGDFYVDGEALFAMKRLAEDTKNPLASETADLTVALCDIKTALRLCKSPLNDYLLEYGLVPCDHIDVNGLKNALKKGENGVFEYLEHTPFSYLCEYKGKNAFLEKKTEDEITLLSQNASLVAFGIDPLISYWLNFEAVMKNIRIIVMGKKLGTEKSAIEERIREIYV